MKPEIELKSWEEVKAMYVNTTVEEMAKIVPVQKEALESFINFDIRDVKDKINFKAINKDVYFTIISITSLILLRGNNKDGFNGASKMETEVFTKDKKKIVCYTPIVTTKYKDYEDIPGLMIKLYKAISIELNTYIMSDSKQSSHSKDVWKKWFNNPNKYKIKKIFAYDKKLEEIINFDDIEDSWCDDCERYRIVAKWF